MQGGLTLFALASLPHIKARGTKRSGAFFIFTRKGLLAAAELRNQGIRTRLASNQRKLKKSLASVSAEGIPYAILIGEDEAAAGVVRLKRMADGMELTTSLQEAVELIAQSIGS